MKKLLLIIFIVLLSITFVFSEDNSNVGLTDALQKMSSEAIEGYLGGLPSGFLTNLNSGWFHKNPKAEIWGINFEVGVVAMGVPMGEMSKNFSLITSYTLTADQAKQFVDASLTEPAKTAAIKALTGQSVKVQLSGPTVFGSKNEKVTIKVVDPTISIAGQSYTLNTGTSYAIDGVTGYGDDISGIG